LTREVDDVSAQQPQSMEELKRENQALRKENEEHQKENQVLQQENQEQARRIKELEALLASRQ